MAGIVAGGTAEGIVAGDTAAGSDTETLDIAAAKVIECTAPAAARTDKIVCRKEDIGSDNNPSHSRACASIPALGSAGVSCSCLMLTDPVASPRPVSVSLGISSRHGKSRASSSRVGFALM